MKPETTIEETVTADAMAKQVALDKVSRAFSIRWRYRLDMS
jgi:hypothetical protein